MKKQIKSFFFLSSFLFFLSSMVLAQQPAWIDYAKRNALYPEEDYLTGFISANNINDADPGKLKDQYEELAKSKVIQSIQVSIETNNSLTLSNVNGKSGEVFESKSVSFSNAKITGLIAERYYDKKKKNVYAFAYVNKKKLAYYNRKLIAANLEKTKQKLKEGREYMALNDKQNALRSFYEGMPLLAEAEEAQWLLMAVSKEQFVENDLKEIRANKVELNKAISRLQQSKELNIAEAAYFIAYGLFIQLNEWNEPIDVDLCTYQNTDLTSEFSEKWNTEIINGLVKAGNYNMTSGSSPDNNEIQLKGNYWEEGNQLRIHMQVYRDGNIQAAAEGSVSKDWLNKEGIKYIPVQLAKIDQLKSIRLKALSAPQKVKIGKQSDSSVNVLVESLGHDSQVSTSNIPLLFCTKSGELIATGNSNADGLVSVYFPGVSIPAGKTEVYAQVDLSAYADIDTSSIFYLKAKNNNPLLPAKFIIDFVPQAYYVNTTEIINRRQVEIKIIEPVLKKELADKSFQFIDSKADADYLIDVNAATTAGNTYQGIYFSYVDATLSIADAKTGVETFKTSVEQVKGSGSNSKKAGIKALNIASEQLKLELVKYLSTH